MTEAVLGTSPVSEEVVSALYERTDGNPFLCVELLRVLSGTTAQGAVDRLVPATVADAIADRSDRLASGARETLDWAAFLPEPFTFDDLQVVAEAGLEGALEELADAGFLVGGSDGGWSFSHSIIRDAVYGRLPEAERVRRHGVVADALKGGPPERLAPQLEYARRWTEGAEAYLTLGESALNAAQGEDASRLFERAEELARTGKDGPLARRARTGQVLALVGAGEQDTARRAADALRSELRANAAPAERLGFLSRYASEVLFVQFDPQLARDALEEAEPLMERRELPMRWQQRSPRGRGSRCASGNQAGRLWMPRQRRSFCGRIATRRSRRGYSTRSAWPWEWSAAWPRARRSSTARSSGRSRVICRPRPRGAYVNRSFWTRCRGTPGGEDTHQARRDDRRRARRDHGDAPGKPRVRRGKSRGSRRGPRTRTGGTARCRRAAARGRALWRPRVLWRICTCGVAS